MSINILYI